MFGSTYPIFDAHGIVSEFVRNPDLAEYVRWEDRPADRSSVIRSIKRRRTATRRVRFDLGRQVAHRRRGSGNDMREIIGRTGSMRPAIPPILRVQRHHANPSD